MADVVIDSESTDPQALVQLATKAEIIRDFNAAVAAYSKAIELIVAEHGDKHDSLGDIYLAYGKALLEISRDESEPLGDAVQHEYSSDSEAEEDDKAKDEKEKSDCAGDAVSEKAGDTKKMEEVGKNDNKEEKEANGCNKEEGKADDGEPTNGSSEEEPTDLQLAWEVLEMAKMIYEKRGDKGRRGLSETLVVLGEVSLESENFENAIVDMKTGLEIQKEICKPYDRALAESYYKLGTALSTNNQIDESIESYNASLEVLKKRVDKLQLDKVSQRDEIADIENLMPDILEKISDMKNFKEEAAMKMVAAMASQPVAKTAPTFEAGSSDKKVSDISHLVKRKRKEDEVKDDENPTKKISP